MNKKVYYVAPDFNELELKQEGILCVSERESQIDQLDQKYDWSDMWN